MEESRKITRKSASNLALAFVLLPKPRRDAMSALYAFCRHIDDVADDESIPTEERAQRLSNWRKDILLACENGQPAFTINRELQPFIVNYHLSFELFDELLRGVEMDLHTKRYETYDQLDLYCYRVASVVGLLSIEIFGYKDAACRDYAIHLGKALQLTNILRDVGSDARRGRIYLPLAELARWSVSPEEVIAGNYSERFEKLAQSVANRARQFYRLARETLPPTERRSMIAAELMGSVYWRLLTKLEQIDFQVLGPTPARLNKAQKFLLIVGTWCRLGMGAMSPSYGA
jgi:phytoene synthase